MNQLSKSYDKLSKDQKKDLIQGMYINQNKSFADIAHEYNTYPNKIRRDAISLKIPIRDKSDAQKNALKTGKHKHPTKGSKRNELTKQKIGMGVMTSWENLTSKELADRKRKCKEAWENLDDNVKQNITKSANNAVRKASKTGSKLESFLLNRLLEDGYKIEFHKEQTLSNTKLQIDLFVPSISTAIEVDGPSHFLPVWGEDALQKNIAYDQKKEGLILGRGMVLIRIKQTKDFSKTRATIIYNRLVDIIKQISSQFPTADNRKFLIED
jgi:very-short-patch-repair endonuclease